MRILKRSRVLSPEFDWQYDKALSEYSLYREELLSFMTHDMRRIGDEFSLHNGVVKLVKLENSNLVIEMIVGDMQVVYS